MPVSLVPIKSPYLMPTCAVIVTMNPDVGFVERMSAIAAEFTHLIVVDNGSSALTKQVLKDAASRLDVTLIQNEVNEGVGQALNLGIAAAEARGYDWVVTFDQDSEPAVGFVAAIYSRLRDEDTSSIAVVGPRIVGRDVPDHESKWLARSRKSRYFFRRQSCSDQPKDVTVVITSGALTSVAAWRTLGGFDQTLFVDYVDTDFCLRARAAGFRIIACCGAALHHNLGARRPVRALGRTFYPTFHSPLRHYYIARNRIHMIRRHARDTPHWFIADIVMATYNGFRVLILEQDSLSKILGGALGTIDGLRGVTGPCKRQVVQQ